MRSFEYLQDIRAKHRRRQYPVSHCVCRILAALQHQNACKAFYAAFNVECPLLCLLGVESCLYAFKQQFVLEHFRICNELTRRYSDKLIEKDPMRYRCLQMKLHRIHPLKHRCMQLSRMGFPGTFQVHGGNIVIFLVVEHLSFNNRSRSDNSNNVTFNKSLRKSYDP